MEKQNDLIVIDQSTAMEKFTTPNGLDPVLERIKYEASVFVGDVSTLEGRKNIRDMAKKVQKSRTYVEKVRKGLVTELKLIPKKIDAEGKRAKDILKELQNTIEAPLVKWDADETARVENHKNNFNFIVSVRDSYNNQLDTAQITNLVAELNRASPDSSWEEYEEDALNLKNSTMQMLRTAWSARVKYEAEQKELQKLREEKEARDKLDRDKTIADQAAAKAKDDAKKEAEREIEAGKQRENALQAQKELAEKREIEAKKQAEIDKEAAELRAKKNQQIAIENERNRIKHEENLKKQEDLKRQSDINHRELINKTIMQSLMNNGFDFLASSKIVTLAADRKLGNLFVRY